MTTEMTQKSHSTNENKDTQLAHEAHHDLFPSERSFFNWLTVCAVGFASLVFALSAHHIYNNQFRVGDVADHDLVASHASLVIDEVSTKQAREKAKQAVMPVFKTNKDAD